jgi:hypothetical protein
MESNYMSNLIQLVYASRSNLPVLDEHNTIPLYVSQILSKSRHNNRNRKLVGALYFGNGYFYQCLEGEEKDVLDLLETLKSDQRHKDLLVISSKQIAKRSFGNWEMKYVPAEKEIQELIKSFGMKSFNPYLFDEKINSKMLQLLQEGANLAQQDQNSPQNGGTSIFKNYTFWKFATAALVLLLCADLIRQYLS